ncbi:MAG: hypothetical protein IKN57_09280 [Parasporobacterium sp.]|nr:hypothetical protein [Parasporobacterium sp.]
MSALILKILAVVSMLIDHTAASCFSKWGLSRIQVSFLNGMSLYTLGRIIGRSAFLIYCFQIVEGVKYSKDLRKYALRLGILAIVSEIPFDFGLHGLSLFSGQLAAKGFWESIDWKHQNVFFTLLLGMLCVSLLKLSRQWLYKKKDQHRCFLFLCIMRYVLYAGLSIATGWFAKYVMHTDYGMGGVVMICIIGLKDEHWEDLSPFLPQRIFDALFCAAGLYACCSILNSTLEKYAAFALIPIILFNGKKGYSSKKLQYAFYTFYPVHLMVLGALKYLT